MMIKLTLDNVNELHTETRATWINTAHVAQLTEYRNSLGSGVIVGLISGLCINVREPLQDILLHLNKSDYGQSAYPTSRY